MKKKLTSLILAAVVLLGLSPSSVGAANEADDGSFGLLSQGEVLSEEIEFSAAHIGETALGEPPLLDMTSFAPQAIEISVASSLRDIDSIVEMARALPHSGFDAWAKTTRFSTQPRYRPPYAAGSLHPADIADALNVLKMVRYVAGLPYENVKFTDELNNISQHGAVLLAASNQFTHWPTKPGDMDTDFYELGFRGCSEANLSAGYPNISGSILQGWVADPGANNIEYAGHRRWILRPNAQNFGIGHAQRGGGSYGGYRSSMHVFSGGLDSAFDYVAWPAAGDFPIQYFVADTDISYAPPYPWTLNLGAGYRSPNRDSAVLTLTRQRDGKVWTFDSSVPNLGVVGLNNSMHFAVDDGGYGMGKAIVFRPDLKTLGRIRDGDVFHVSLSGIRTATGEDTTLEYTINFFDLEKAKARTRLNITVRHGSTPVSGAVITIDGQTLTTDSNGHATLRVRRNRTHTYTVRKVGYRTETGSVRVGNEPSSVDISLTAYTINASLLTSFGSVQTPYEQPAARTVTITNIGPVPLTLATPTSVSYEIGALSTFTLPAHGDTATFTVRPRAGLPAGRYNETITINGSGGASASVSASFTVTAPPLTMSLNKSYIILQEGKSSGLAVSYSVDPNEVAAVRWVSSDRNIADVDAEGLVTAAGKGSAIITANNDRLGISAQCRVDVIENDAGSTVRAVNLLERRASVNAHSTTPVRVPIQLELEQNYGIKPSSYDFAVNSSTATSLAPDNIEYVKLPADTGGHFKVTAIDDRFVELVPTSSLAASGIKRLVTALEVKVYGRPETFLTKELTLSITRAMPRVKAKAVRFSSFSPSNPIPVIFTVNIGEITAIRLDGNKNDNGMVSFNEDTRTLTLNNATQRPRRLAFKAMVEGFGEREFEVPMSVSVTSRRPDIKPGAKSLNMHKGAYFILTGRDVALVDPDGVSADNAGFTVAVADRQRGIYKLTYKEGEDGFVERRTSLKLTIRLSDGGAQLPLTFTVNPFRAIKGLPAIRLSARGRIDAINPESTVTLTPKFTNFNYGGSTIVLLDQDDEVFEISGVNPMNGAVTLRVTPEAYEANRLIGTDGKIKNVGIRLTYMDGNGNTCQSAQSAKSPALTIKPRQGKVRLVQSVRAVSLQSNDRFSEGHIDISAAIPAAARIDRVEVRPTNANNRGRLNHANAFTVRQIQSGSFAVGFKDGSIDSRVTGAPGKSRTTTIRLNVYLVGSSRPQTAALRVIVG